MARIGWDAVAPHVRGAIEAIAGAAIVDVTPVTGGFSPCFAGRLHLADGRAVFAKAVSADQNPDSPAYLRRELTGTNHVPTSVAAPRLLGRHDDGHWIAGVFTAIDGALPALPWRPADLAAATRAVAAAGATTAPAELPPVEPHLAALMDGWRSLPDADPRLRALEAAAPDAAAGDRLVHLDIRADNLLLTADPSAPVVIVDWAYASRGAGWLDAVLWAPALELEGGGPPEATLAAWPGVRPAPDELLPVVAGLAGYFVHRGGLPDPPGLPTLRAFQRAQGAPARAWLERLLAAST